MCLFWNAMGMLLNSLYWQTVKALLNGMQLTAKECQGVLVIAMGIADIISEGAR